MGLGLRDTDEIENSQSIKSQNVKHIQTHKIKNYNTSCSQRSFISLKTYTDISKCGKKNNIQTRKTILR